MWNSWPEKACICASCEDQFLMNCEIVCSVRSLFCRVVDFSAPAFINFVANCAAGWRWWAWIWIPLERTWRWRCCRFRFRPKVLISTPDWHCLPVNLQSSTGYVTSLALCMATASTERLLRIDRLLCNVQWSRLPVVALSTCRFITRFITRLDIYCHY